MVGRLNQVCVVTTMLIEERTGTPVIHLAGGEFQAAQRVLRDDRRRLCRIPRTMVVLAPAA